MPRDCCLLIIEFVAGILHVEHNIRKYVYILKHDHFIRFKFIAFKAMLTCFISRSPSLKIRIYSVGK